MRSLYKMSSTLLTRLIRNMLVISIILEIQFPRYNNYLNAGPVLTIGEGTSDTKRHLTAESLLKPLADEH